MSKKKKELTEQELEKVSGGAIQSANPDGVFAPQMIEGGKAGTPDAAISINEGGRAGQTPGEGGTCGNPDDEYFGGRR